LEITSTLVFIFLIKKKFLNRVEPKPTSIEREIFPQMAKEGELYTFQLEGFWADLGTPKDYVHASGLFLSDLAGKGGKELAPKSNNIVGNVLIDSTAMIHDNCLLGPNVVIGPGVVVKSGARIKNSVVLDKAIVGENSYVDGSILGWRSKIGKWARIEGLSILAEEVVVSDEVFINSSIILPNVPVKSSISTPNSIILF